jgi:hypothetical protein
MGGFNPFLCKSEGMRRLSIVLAGIFIVLWVGLIADATWGFTRIEPRGWLMFFGVPVAIYLVILAAIRVSLWVIHGFQSSAEWHVEGMALFLMFAIVVIGLLAVGFIPMKHETAESTTAWSTVSVALVALIALWLQRRDAKALLAVQIATQLNADYDTRRMRRARRATASALLNQKPIPDEWVLNFYEGVGQYLDHGLLPPWLVWSDYSYAVLRYWAALGDDIRRIRDKAHGDETLYDKFQSLHDAMVKEDMRQRRKEHRSDVIPTAEDIRQFLEDESAMPDWDEEPRIPTA